MTSATSAARAKPGSSSTAPQPPHQDKPQGVQNLDVTPQDLKKYLSQPIRAIFFEQAKSIVAIQVGLFRNLTKKTWFCFEFCFNI